MCVSTLDLSQSMAVVRKFPRSLSDCSVRIGWSGPDALRSYAPIWVLCRKGGCPREPDGSASSGNCSKGDSEDQLDGTVIQSNSDCVCDRQSRQPSRVPVQLLSSFERVSWFVRDFLAWYFLCRNKTSLAQSEEHLAVAWNLATSVKRLYRIMSIRMVSRGYLKRPLAHLRKRIVNAEAVRDLSWRLR